jgi:hypothetical protein
MRDFAVSVDAYMIRFCWAQPRLKFTRVRCFFGSPLEALKSASFTPASSSMPSSTAVASFESNGCTRSESVMIFTVSPRRRSVPGV